MIIAALGLDRLNDNSGGWVVVSRDEFLDLVKAPLLLGLVLRCVLVKRVLAGRERSLRPVEGGDVELVDRLAAGRRQRGKETSMEGGTEGQNRQGWRTRRFVVHG